MHPDQTRPSKPDLVVVLTELSKELRTAVDALAVETITVYKLVKETRNREGRESELVAACNHRQEVLERFNEIWDRARKPIITLGMLGNHGEKLLAEFRCLPVRPNVLEARKFVEFFEVYLHVDSAVTMEPGDKDGEGQEVATAAENVEAIEKRGRGRPVEISEEQKTAAWEVMKQGGSAHAAAQILYNKKQPSKRDRDNVYSILKAFSKKHGSIWPPA
jgi:hypothetical protein